MNPWASEITAWVFDLDNTLYPSTCDLFPQVERRMVAFIAQWLGVGEDAAWSIRRDTVSRYGTTLRGLMTEYGLEPGPYLAFVHAVDFSRLRPDPRMVAALAGLPGQRLVFTNGSRDYARAVLNQLGLSDFFSAIFDIADQNYIPKPDPGGTTALVAQFGIEPARTLLIEDMACNLVPAAALGMHTLWVRTPLPQAQPRPGHPPPQHETDDLAGWLLEGGATGRKEGF